VGDELRDAIVAGKSIDDLRRIAVSTGMVTLGNDGFLKVREGITTLEEVLHVAGDIRDPQRFSPTD
jgi:type IV pilus assembly protein PilB